MPSHGIVKIDKDAFVKRFLVKVVAGQSHDQALVTVVFLAVDRNTLLLRPEKGSGQEKVSLDHGQLI